MRSATPTLVLTLLLLMGGGSVIAQSRKPSSKEAAPPLVVVGGKTISAADLDRRMKTRQVPAEMREKLRRPFLEEMADEILIREFLAAKKISATKQEVDREVKQIHDQAARNGANPETVLIEVGYTTQSLRQELSLPLAWKHYFERTITATEIQEHFRTHRSEFDGTKVRARQIVLKVASTDEADWKAAEELLADLRQKISQGTLDFADAAREHSYAPSREQGGDVGYFPYSGKMPATFAHQAFQLEEGELSQPFRSTFGVHLCEVTDRIPGDLSLEDVRDEVISRMSKDLWKQTVADLKNKSKIEWKTTP
ncbi:MAG: peptidylprolyl isomerase [Planctomycetales bacterium]